MKAEVKVAILFIVALVLTAGFAFLLGDFQPFSSGGRLEIAYNFAGGVEKGSPVRLMGVKVGKVSAIRFVPGMKLPSGEEVNLKVIVSIDRDAWGSIRQDSKYFINLAGVIGEKFIEITAGSQSAPPVEPGSLVRGEDPPRIDQLLSQSYSLAGKIIEIVEKNEGSVKSTLDTMDRLVTNLNKALLQLDKTTKNEDIHKLVGNMVKISDDVAYFTGNLRKPESEKTFKLVQELIWRLEKLDAQAIKKFLQDEGIKAKLF